MQQAAHDQQVNVVDQKIHLGGGHILLFVLQDRDKVEDHGRAADAEQAAAQPGDDAYDGCVAHAGLDVDFIAEKEEPNGQQDQEYPQQPFVNGRGRSAHEEHAGGRAQDTKQGGKGQLPPLDVPPAADQNGQVEQKRQAGGDIQRQFIGQKQRHGGHHDDAKPKPGDCLQQRAAHGEHTQQKHLQNKFPLYTAKVKGCGKKPKAVILYHRPGRKDCQRKNLLATDRAGRYNGL